MSSISAGTTSTTALVSTADTTGALVLKTGASATTAVTIDTSQNVGIGTSSPAAKLHTYAASGVGPTGLFYNNANAAELKIQTNANDAAFTSYYTNGNRNWSVGPGQTTANLFEFRDLTAGATRMGIDSSGNVGIGTSSPSYELEVSKSKTSAVTNVVVNNPDNAGGAAFKAISQTGAHTAVLGITDAGGGGRVGTISNEHFYFITNNTERARIDSSGNVFINATGAIGGSGGNLQVKGPASSTAVVIGIGTDGQNGIRFMNSAGSQAGTIVVNTSTTTYNSGSDYRLKENIQPMTGALGKVAQLKPVTFKWKIDGADGEGFIAHELQEVCPDAVSGTKDAVDAEGNPEYQGIDTSFLVATLTAAIQELKAEVDDLRAKLEAK